MKKHAWKTWLGLALVGGLAGCSLGLDFRASQCETNADCVALGATTCDTVAKVCLGGTGGGGAGGAGGAGGVGGAGGSMGGGGAGGTNPDDCLAVDKGPPLEISSSITDNFTLTCDRDWLLVGQVFVEDGVTLSIEAGTTVLGGINPRGALIVKPGGKLNAIGTADRPIVFTSAAPPAVRQPGDWGGVVILGKASSNNVDSVSGLPAPQAIEGVDPPVFFGGLDGTNDADSSGVLRYLRIEYAGFALAPNNELNGLTFGGVGSGTVVDHIQVRSVTDDCFEFFGGTVNASHLICWNGQDDFFDFDNGYRGKLQFLFGRSDPDFDGDNNGFEVDNNAGGTDATPFTDPQVYNATILGKNILLDGEQYGLLLRRGTRGVYHNLVVSGFEAGLDVRNDNTLVSIAGSIFFGNLVFNLAYPEVAGGMDAFADDDGGYDEDAELLAQGNLEVDPALPDPFNGELNGALPPTTLSTNALTPPDDGFFDATATFSGAFRDATDDWATGNWVIFAEQ